MEAAGGDIVAPVMASQPSTLSFAGHVTIERACRHGSSANETHPDRPYGITIDGEYFSLQSPLFRSIVFNYWWLSLVIIGGLRLCMRQYFMGDWFTAAQHVPFANRDDGLTKVAIYGAGVAGNQLVAALRMGRVLRPVAFIDDDPSIADRSIAGLQVYKPKHIQQMTDVTGAQEILLALPSSTRARRQDILTILERFPLHI